LLHLVGILFIKSRCTETRNSILLLSVYTHKKCSKLFYSDFRQLVFRVTIPDAVLIQSDLLRMSKILLETCTSKTIVINVLKICASSWSLVKVILRCTVSETKKNIGMIRLSTLSTGLLYQTGIFLVLISFRGCIEVRAIVRPKGIYQ
jgi:hypothetical protein